MRDDLQPLAQRIAEIEAQSGPRPSPLTSRPSNAWDEILLGGKLNGALVELLEAEEGIGAWTLALCLARRACGDHKVLVVVDGEGRFYPPAAAQLEHRLAADHRGTPTPGALGPDGSDPVSTLRRRRSGLGQARSAFHHRLPAAPSSRRNRRRRRLGDAPGSRSQHAVVRHAAPVAHTSEEWRGASGEGREYREWRGKRKRRTYFSPLATRLSPLALWPPLPLYSGGEGRGEGG